MEKKGFNHMASFTRAYAYFLHEMQVSAGRASKRACRKEAPKILVWLRTAFRRVQFFYWLCVNAFYIFFTDKYAHTYRQSADLCGPVCSRVLHRYAATGMVSLIIIVLPLDIYRSVSHIKAAFLTPL